MATTIVTTRAEPNSRLGAPRTHRRLDRPPARGHGPADSSLQARAGARAGDEPEGAGAAADFDDEIDLRAEDDALIAAELDAAEAAADDGADEADEDDEAPSEKPRRRRRGRRGGAAAPGAARPAAARGHLRPRRRGLRPWLDPAVQDDPIYAEYWAGHRPVEVTIEEDQIVIRRAGEDDGTGRDE